jgi:hypothetical protein
MGPDDRPSGEPDERNGPALKSGIEAYEDGHQNVVLVLVDLDVVETVYDPLKELDTERLIIRSAINPIP